LTDFTTLGLAAPPATAPPAAGAALGVLGLTDAAATAGEAVAGEEVEIDVDEDEEEEDCLAILLNLICELVGLLFYTHLRGVCLSYFDT
jgi:hypothetical protein